MILTPEESAEGSLIGSLLIDSYAIDRVGRLSPSDFQTPINGKVFRAIQTLKASGSSVGIVEVMSELRKTGDDDGAIGYLAGLAGSVSTSINAESYARIVREESHRKKVGEAGLLLQQASLSKTKDPKDLLQQAHSILAGLADEQSSGWVSMPDLMDEVDDEFAVLKDNRTAVTGLSTGLLDLDKVTTGLHPGHLIVVAGVTGIGKSSLMDTFVHHAAVKEGRGVAIFSLEMSAVEIAKRMICMMAQVDSQKLRTGYANSFEWERIDEAVQRLATVPIHIFDRGGAGLGEIQQEAGAITRRADIALIVVDYLQLVVGSKSEGRVQEVGGIARALKGLARNLKVPVVALSQLNRQPDQRASSQTRGRTDDEDASGKARPQLHDIRESGDIEHASDLVIGIYRSSYYTKNATDLAAELIVMKNRHGPLKTVHVGWLADRMEFVNAGYTDEPF